MPKSSQWAIRLALLYLLLGFTFGALMLANKGVPLHASLWRLLPVHIEMLLIGWTLQLALGVAFWIMPRFWASTRPSDKRGPLAVIILLNLGLWSVIGGNWLSVPHLLLGGRILEAGAVLAFAVHIWPRIVGRQG